MIVVSVYHNIGSISLPNAINWITEWWYQICRWMVIIIMCQGSS